MKDSKEKEYRISNLKNMLNNIKDSEVEDKNSFTDEKENNDDEELIQYLHEDEQTPIIDDEFIYNPAKDLKNHTNLENGTKPEIDENFIIKTDLNDFEEDSLEEESKDKNNDELFNKQFDNLVNYKIGKRPILSIIGFILGIFLIIASVYILCVSSQKIVDNVVSGETNVSAVIIAIFGILILIFSIYKMFSLKNPFNDLANSIEEIENKETDKKPKAPPTKSQVTEESIDREAYKIGEFSLSSIKTSSKKSDLEKDINLEKKESTSNEDEKIDNEKEESDSKSIDDIFAEIEEIDEIPIVAIDKKMEKEE
jgi:ABC-type multidrug transport system fused ATPase/permease subunit